MLITVRGLTCLRFFFFFFFFFLSFPSFIDSQGPTSIRFESRFGGKGEEKKKEEDKNPCEILKYNASRYFYDIPTYQAAS